MQKNIKTPTYIFSKRAKIMKFLKKEGYSLADIGIMFNVDRSRVLRILETEAKYKGLVKGMLSDKK